MIKKIVIEVSGKDHELTVHEAKELLNELKSIFPDSYPQPITPLFKEITPYYYNSPYNIGFSSVCGSASSAFD